ncbi:MAG TPA: PAS domain S-box protein [Blastocatellia bacterium]|nr:PAS domain S-box protein [Blastocatellia bacterium]
MSSRRLFEAAAAIAADTKILCANLDSRQLMRVSEALSLIGASPTLVDGAEPILEAARRYCAVVILTSAPAGLDDISDRLSQLKQDSKRISIPVLVMVGSTLESTTAQRILELGADDIVEDWLPIPVLALRTLAMIALHRQSQAHTNEVSDEPSGQGERQQGPVVDRTVDNTPRPSEAHFRSLIENALDLITIVDANGIMLYQSPSIEKTLGYSPDYLVGRNTFDFIHPEDVPTVSQALGKIVEAPGTTESSVFRFRHKDGSWRVLEAIGKTPPDAGIGGVVVNSRDVTESKQLQEQLIRSEKLAAMGQLVSGVAHELNNPLTSVIGFTQLMITTGALDLKSMERLEIIKSQADRARRIVQNLLSFGRQKRPEKSEVDLNRLLDKVLELRSYYMEVNNILVVRDFGKVLPALADAAQMEQVFLNIIINAEQAILGVRRGGKIVINTSMRREDQKYRTRVVIADDGPGITPEFLGKIFDPFFSTKRVGEGTGLGLSISYGIVKEHGGLLEVSSEAGVGTTFIVELPAAGTGGALYGTAS